VDRPEEVRHNAGAENVGSQQPDLKRGQHLHASALKDHFLTTLSLPQEAAQWLLDIWACIQLFDDVADGDRIYRDDLDRVIWATLVEMPANPFFASRSALLIPVLATQILKWQASDAIERAGNADAKTYMWRAGYYDLIAFVVQLCHGRDMAQTIAPTVLSLYGEDLNEYISEFCNA